MPPTRQERRAFWRELRAQHPRLREALVADLRVTLVHRGEWRGLNAATAAYELLRLCLVSDAFFAQLCYRIKARLQALRIPLLPRIAHRLAIITGQVMIGDPVVVRPGLYLLHGQVVIDGLVVVGEGAVIAPFTTIGLIAGEVRGPTIGSDVHIGTGARVLGPVTIGDGARVGANAVVLQDVDPGTTVAGVPARVLG